MIAEMHPVGVIDSYGHDVTVDFEARGVLRLDIGDGMGYFSTNDPTITPRAREDARRAVHAVACALLAGIGLQAPVDWPLLRPGDPDPTVRGRRQGEAFCGRYFGGADGTRWACTRPSHQDGVCVTSMSRKVVAVLLPDGTLRTEGTERDAVEAAT